MAKTQAEDFISVKAPVKASKTKVKKVFCDKDRMLQLVDIVNRQEDDKIKDKLAKQVKTNRWF
jgi:hypothetical protein